MKFLAKYQNRSTYWLDYKEVNFDHLPTGNWVCFASSSKIKPDVDLFDRFTRRSIKNGLLEFKGHGLYGEELHDWFDQTIAIMETMEKHPPCEIMTTWHDDESFDDVLWQCYFATCLPDKADFDNISVVCTDLDGIDRSAEILYFLNKFEKGYIPG